MCFDIFLIFLYEMMQDPTVFKFPWLHHLPTPQPGPKVVVLPPKAQAELKRSNTKTIGALRIFTNTSPKPNMSA